MSKNSKINRLQKEVNLFKEMNKQLNEVIDHQGETIRILEEEVCSGRGRIMKLLGEIKYQLNEHIFEKTEKQATW